MPFAVGYTLHQMVPVPSLSNPWCGRAPLSNLTGLMQEFESHIGWVCSAAPIYGALPSYQVACRSGFSTMS